MKQYCFVLLLFLASLNVFGQKFVISGTVVNDRTGAVIPQVSVSAEGERTSVVTNDEGFFSLKLDKMPRTLVVSHLGFETLRYALPSSNVSSLSIRLKPTSLVLQEVVVWTENPRDLVQLALSKVPENYSTKPVLYKCFYREAAMKRKHYIFVAEGVVDMYKTSYKQNSFRDKVSILKGRRLLSPKESDTLGVKVLGGPVMPLYFDIVKNTDFLLNEEDMANYDFKMDGFAVIDDRVQYVVSLSPLIWTPWALFYGKIYIDHDNLSFSRMELSLDMRDTPRATNYMLRKKPNGVRFKPKEFTILVDYKQDEGKTHISYLRSTYRFNCDWKRKLFATNYSITCEMMVTDRQEDDVQPIRGRESFDSRDAFYDKVDYFLDTKFWEDYNIIEPTETLDKAIDKLLKKYKK
jgi:hypothetical protein